LSSDIVTPLPYIQGAGIGSNELAIEDPDDKSSTKRQRGSRGRGAEGNPMNKSRGYNEPRHFDRALIYINVSPLKS